MRKGILAVSMAALVGWCAQAAWAQPYSYPNPYGGTTTVHVFGAGDPHGHYVPHAWVPPYDPRTYVPEMPGLWPRLWPWYVYGPRITADYRPYTVYSPYRWPW